MSEHRLTPENFDRNLRSTLRYGHGFEHGDLERAKSIMSDAIAHVEQKAGTKLGMGAEHLDTAMKFLNKEHKEWKALPSHKREHVEAALKAYFAIPEPEQEAA